MLTYWKQVQKKKTDTQSWNENVLLQIESLLLGKNLNEMKHHLCGKFFFLPNQNILEYQKKWVIAFRVKDIVSGASPVSPSPTTSLSPSQPLLSLTVFMSFETHVCMYSCYALWLLFRNIDISCQQLRLHIFAEMNIRCTRKLLPPTHPPLPCILKRK